jgi:threonine dehydrogenase-like Zn-dependent dehydrogenase
MLHVLPEDVPDKGASLYEPLSIACHGLLRSQPTDGDPILIVGAGVIGLASLAAIKGLFPNSPVTVLARHQHQVRAAEACGADHVVMSEERGAHFEELAVLSGTRVVGYKSDLMLMGGFPYVVEAVGAARSVTEALRAVAQHGTVLLLGAAGVTEVDLTPLWYKEAALVGSIDHQIDSVSTAGVAGGHDRHSVDRAIDIMSAGLLPADVVVTHEFGLDEYRRAIETAIDRGNAQAIKVVLRP